jgi:hypothetical protein
MRKTWYSTAGSDKYRTMHKDLREVFICYRWSSNENHKGNRSQSYNKIELKFLEEHDF